jgi:DNA-binding beta-propeller fold protein YncE
MKNKWIVWIALSLIIIILAILVNDLFSGRDKSTQNVYEYQLDKFKKVDSGKICYKETRKIKPSSASLHGIAVDDDDNIYITSGNRVIKYNPAGDSVCSFKTRDTAFCITTRKSGDIFVGMKDHIEQYNSKGKLLKAWEKLGKTAYFTSVTSDDSSVYVADAGNKIVHRYSLKGELIGEIGKKDKSKDILGFFIPSPYFDVLIDKQGQLWAINTGRHAFEAYTKSGELITRWAKVSMDLDGFSGCCNPTNVAILSDGSFVTSEKGIARVKIHLATGDFKCVVAGPDQFVDGTTGLDLAVDSKDRILVLDPVKNMVRIFTKIE